MSESLDYLQPGFDPASLTVPRLRSILITYNIQYPASAKKQQLVEIFNSMVVPQARKILATRARAKRTSEGIVDADSQDSITTSQADEELEPSPPPPPRRTTRSSSPRKMSNRPNRLTSEEQEELPARTPRRVPARTAIKHTRTSDTDEAEDQIQRSLRRASAQPRRGTSPRKVMRMEPEVKIEESDDDTPRMRNNNVFTYDNPFQSGSSPPSSRRSTSDSRRKTVGISEVRDNIRKKAADSSRRRTDVPQSAGDRGIHPPSAATFHMPATQTDGLTDVDDNGIEASEEFTPEAQEELVEERELKGTKALGPLRPKKQSGGMSLAGPMWVILMTILAGYAAWYRKEKLAVGYCGVGRPATQIISSKISSPPEWLTILAEPKCEPCPQHAYCYADLETKCDPDFVLKMHPLSLGGIVPLAPTCEPDGEKVKRVQAVTNRAIEQLRDQRAKFECGELASEVGGPEPAAAVDIEVLKQEVSKRRRKAMTDEEFEELWNGAIGEIKARDEVEIKVDSITNRETLSSSSLALVSASCALRRSFRITLAKYYARIGSLIVIFAVISSIYRKILADRRAEARVPDLVALTLDRLATQASLHAQDEDTFPEGWISIGQLRDDVLREEHSIKKRAKLWSKVQKVVEMNANVRAGQRESRNNGEISRVWEWIGNVVPVQVPDVGSARRKSGRVSFGTYGVAATPVSGDDGGPRWAESRPIY